MITVSVVNKPEKPVYRLVTPDKDMPALLYHLLLHKTPHKEEDVVEKIIIDYVKKYNPDANIEQDKFGNVRIRVGTDIETLFSCHTDTVHRRSGEIRLALTTGPTDSQKGYVVAFDKEQAERSILGADDKVGCFILCEMIAAGIGGLYIFHRGEERGGLGSQWIADHDVGILKGIKRAVAFDRANYTDIIDNQRGGVCCSKAFVDALKGQLDTSVHRRGFVNTKFASAVGSFTDTASYIYDVSECTNISVGYFNQHSKEEYFDLVWLTSILLPSVMEVKWNELPSVRALSKKWTSTTYNTTKNWGQPASGYTPPKSDYTYKAGMKTSPFPSRIDDILCAVSFGRSEHLSLQLAYDKDGFNMETPQIIRGAIPWVPSECVPKDATDTELKRRIFRFACKSPWAISKELFTTAKYMQEIEKENLDKDNIILMMVQELEQLKDREGYFISDQLDTIIDYVNSFMEEEGYWKPAEEFTKAATKEEPKIEENKEDAKKDDNVVPLDADPNAFRSEGDDTDTGDDPADLPEFITTAPNAVRNATFCDDDYDGSGHIAILVDNTTKIAKMFYMGQEYGFFYSKNKKKLSVERVMGAADGTKLYTFNQMSKTLELICIVSRNNIKVEIKNAGATSQKLN